MEDNSPDSHGNSPRKDNPSQNLNKILRIRIRTSVASVTAVIVGIIVVRTIIIIIRVSAVIAIRVVVKGICPVGIEIITIKPVYPSGI